MDYQVCFNTGSISGVWSSTYNSKKNTLAEAVNGKFYA